MYWKFCYNFVSSDPIKTCKRHCLVRKLMPKMVSYILWFTWNSYILVASVWIYLASKLISATPLTVRLLQLMCSPNVMGPPEREIWGSKNETFWRCFVIKEICYNLQSCVWWETWCQEIYALATEETALETPFTIQVQTQSCVTQGLTRKLIHQQYNQAWLQDID